MANAVVDKLNNTTVLSSGASWNGGVVPVSTDVARWNFNGANTVGAGTGVNFGAIRITSTQTQTVQIDAPSSGTLTLTGLAAVVDSLPVGTGISQEAGGQLRFETPVTIAGAQTWNITGNNVYFGVSSSSALITGSATITKRGLGTLASFRAQTSLSSGFAVQEGYLSITTGSSWGSGVLNLNSAGTGTNVGLGSETNNGTVTFANSIDVNGNFSLNFASSGASTQTNLTGPVVLVASSSTITVPVGSSTISGSIVNSLGVPGAKSLTKAGAGTLSLTAANTFSGTTKVTAGTLSITNVNGLQNSTVDWGTSTVGTLSLPASAVLGGLSTASGTPNTFTQNGAYSVGNNNASATFGGILAGTGAITKIGTGSWTLTGNNTNSGAVSVSAGTLNANSATALGAASSTAGISVSSGATLSLGGASNITYTAPRTLTLAGTGVSPGTPGALVIANTVTNTFSGIVLTAGTLVRASESGTLTAPVTTNNHNLTFSVAAGKTLTLPSTSVISASTSTVSYNTVSGDTGTAVVSAQNLYTNPTVIDRGAVRIGASSVGSPGSLTSGPLGRGQLTWNGGALDASTTATLGNNVAVGGNVSFEGTAALTLAGTVSLGASRTVTVNGNYPLYLSGIVSGIGYKITKAGTGKLVLDNAGNTYSGGTDIGAGTVTFASGGLGSSGTIGMLGGALQWAAGNTQDISSRLSITGGVAYFDTGANDVSFATPYTTATGSSVYKLGSGSLTLSYPNNWSGTFVLQAGTVYSGGNGSLGTSAASLNFYAGKVSASSTSFISYSPTGTSLIGGDITFGDAVKTGSQSFACDFSLDSGTRIVTTVAPTTFAGKIYNGNLTKAGSSSLTLSGQSTTYLGLTTLSAGTLGVTNNNALGATAASLALNGGTFASVINDPYTLTMVAAGDSTIGGNVTFGDGLTTGTLTLVNNFALGTSTSRFLTVATGTTQVFTGIISGSGSSIAKNGSGTLRLSGANTYSGGTYIDAGTLQTGNVQALGTSGTVTLSVSGATLQTLTTGGQNGKLTVANLTNSAGGTIRIGG